MANKICAVYSEDALTERTMRKWFARFKAGEDLEDTGRLSASDEDLIKTVAENNNK